ncbi:MAG: hypothetical protein U0Z17_05650 [Bacteroidales bacterium]
MKYLIPVLLFVLAIHSGCFSQVVINEVQTSNKSSIADEDGDYEDWIELYNSGVSVNLQPVWTF